MRFTDVLGIAKQYLLLGTICGMFLILLFLCGYFLLYKKWMKGTKRISGWRTVLWFAFILYIIVVLGATLGSRGGWYENSLNLHLFSSYKEAWNSFSAKEWRNLILNIAMFMPLGIFLPFLFRKCRKFWVTYLLGFCASVTIEVLQLLTKRGITELDDIFNNTLGAMIGYGFFFIGFAWVQSRKNRQRMAHKWKVVCLQLPLAVSVIGFLLVFGIYESRELGNLSISYNYKVDMSDITLRAKCDLSDAGEKETVYQTKKYSSDETLDFAKDYFSALGTDVDEAQNDIYEDTVVYYSQDRNYNLWVDFLGESYHFTDFTLLEKDGVEKLTQKEITDILKQYNITIPVEADFSEEGNGSYQISADMIEEDDGLLNGTCDITVVEGDKLSSIYNNLIQYSEYKKSDILSEKEAYEKLEQGKFLLYAYDTDIREMEVNSVSISYEMDSKGFYQPVYVFGVVYNDDTEIKGNIEVPAIR